MEVFTTVESSVEQQQLQLRINVLRQISAICFLESSFKKSFEGEKSIQNSEFLYSWHNNSSVENLKVLPLFSNYKSLLSNMKLSNWIWNSIKFPQVSN